MRVTQIGDRGVMAKGSRFYLAMKGLSFLLKKKVRNNNLFRMPQKGIDSPRPAYFTSGFAFSRSAGRSWKSARSSLPAPAGSRSSGLVVRWRRPVDGSAIGCGWRRRCVAGRRWILLIDWLVFGDRGTIIDYGRGRVAVTVVLVVRIVQKVPENAKPHNEKQRNHECKHNDAETDEENEWR